MTFPSSPRLLAVAAFAAGLGLASLALRPVDADATVLAPLTLDQRVDAAEYIVRGTVADIWTELDGNGLVWTRVLIEVDEALKGQPGDTLLVSEPGGTYGSFRTVVSGVAAWDVGEDVVAFASERGEGRIQLVGMISGKYTLRLDPVTRQEVAQRWAPPGNQPYDHRFIPPPSAADRLLADDLLQDIRDRLELGWDGQPIPGIPTERLRRVNKLQAGVK